MRTTISAAKLRGALTQQIEEISGEKLAACNQCGKCSAGCPLVAEMDLLPNQVIRLLQLGMEEVLTCETIWTCAACLTCVARCPKGIDLPRIMEALRQVTMDRHGDRIVLNRLPPQAAKEIPQVALVGGLRKFTR